MNSFTYTTEQNITTHILPINWKQGYAIVGYYDHPDDLLKSLFNTIQGQYPENDELIILYEDFTTQQVLTAHPIKGLLVLSSMFDLSKAQHLDVLVKAVQQTKRVLSAYPYLTSTKFGCFVRKGSPDISITIDILSNCDDWLKPNLQQHFDLM